MSDDAASEYGHGSEQITPVMIGQRLREAREARGLTTKEAARRMHLPEKIVHALERDDYDSLPSALYVTGYLRAYARLLDLPESDLPIPKQLAKEPKLVGRVTWSSQPVSHEAPVRLITVLIGLFLLGSLVFWWNNNGDELLFERQTNGDIHTRSGEPMLPPSESIPAQEDGSETEPTSLSAESVLAPVSVEEGTASTPSQAPVAVTPAPAPEPAEAAPLMQADIELRFRADSWTEVSDNNDESLAYGLIRAGRVLRLKGEAPFSIFLGFAPGVDVIFNGEMYDHAPFQRHDVARFRLGGPEHNHRVNR